MLSFYNIVIIIAIVLLILGLVLIGMTLNPKNNANAFPQYQSLCPDFWTLDDQKRCIPSVLNTPSPQKFFTVTDISHNGVVLDDPTKPTKIVSLDLSPDNWTSLCDKYKWANKNAILWDGVMNTNQC
jgi:hypothetical protein